MELLDESLPSRGMSEACAAEQSLSKQSRAYDGRSDPLCGRPPVLSVLVPESGSSKSWEEAFAVVDIAVSCVLDDVL